MNNRSKSQLSFADSGNAHDRIGELSPQNIPESYHNGGSGEEDVKELKTGTTTVGIKAKDSIVLAADRRASLQGMVSSKTSVKIHPVHPTAAITISGTVSAAQALVKQLKSEARLYEIRRDKEMTMTALSTMLGNLLRSGAFMVTAPVLGGVDNDGAHVFSFDPIGGMGEEEYTVSGSGSQYALGVLEDQYHSELDLEQAEKIAIQCIRSAVSRDTASGNGVMLSKISQSGVESEVYDDMDAVPEVSF